MASLLTLDASKFVGWSFWKSPADKPHCRTWEAKSRWDSEAYGPYLLEFKTWLNSMLDLLRPDVLAFESPIVVSRGWGKGRGSDENNIRRLISVVGIAELIAMERELVCIEVPNQTAKAYMGVSSRRSSGMTDAQYKQLMIDAMTLRGYRIGDSHQADACAVALVAYEDLGTPVPDEAA
jgi:hypothetical protein